MTNFYRTRLIVSIAFIFVIAGSLQAQFKWEILEDSQGRKIEARIVDVSDGKVTLIRKSDGRKFALKTAKFSEETQAKFSDWPPEKSGQVGFGSDDLSKKLYPKTKDEIKAGLEEIEGREIPSDIEKAQHEAITSLNIYRFLCSVPSDVIADPGLVKKATMAAEACKKAGKLSHDLGDHTESCNISPLGNMAETVQQYIDDPGESNRERRGHRRWCLNPPMGKAGFGTGGDRYSAMWVFDQSGKKAEESWTYPGKGFFPIDRLHGKGWSLYLNENAPSKDDFTVEVFELKGRPEKPFSSSADIPGKALPVPWVSVYKNAINFEPDEQQVSQGIYWVRITGGGVKEGYLVELY